MQAELESNRSELGLKVSNATEHPRAPYNLRQHRERDERILEIAKEVITEVHRSTMPICTPTTIHGKRFAKSRRRMPLVKQQRLCATRQNR
jgi:hypothetical protein